MKPYGLKHKLFANFKDWHPRKNEVNWWEQDCTVPLKKRARQDNKKEIKKGIEDYNDKSN